MLPIALATAFLVLPGIAQAWPGRGATGGGTPKGGTISAFWVYGLSAAMVAGCWTWRRWGGR